MAVNVTIYNSENRLAAQVIHIWTVLFFRHHSGQCKLRDNRHNSGYCLITGSDNIFEYCA